MTLEVIGLTALDYDFHSLDEDDNALANAFQKMMGAQEATKFQTFSRMIRQRLPFTKIYKTKYFRDIDTALNLMHSDCRKMVATRFDQARNGEVEGKTDLLTLLVKANLQAEKESMKLYDHELEGQLDHDPRRT